MSPFFVFVFSFFFFNDTATTEIYTLSLHDALPISPPGWTRTTRPLRTARWWGDRKSTRLNSSHITISYAVFCLKKKKKEKKKYKKIKKKSLYQSNLKQKKQ